LQEIVSRAEDSLPGNAQNILSTFVFLRFICPAITNPHIYGVLDYPPDTSSLRSLILLSKVLQNLATGTNFEKEEYMMAMNDIIDVNKDTMNCWLLSLASTKNQVKKKVHLQRTNTFDMDTSDSDTSNSSDSSIGLLQTSCAL
jgi:hypothetical protein